MIERPVDDGQSPSDQEVARAQASERRAREKHDGMVSALRELQEELQAERQKTTELRLALRSVLKAQKDVAVYVSGCISRAAIEAKKLLDT